MPRQLSFEISRDDGRASVAIASDLDMARTLKLEPQVDALVNDSPLELLVLALRSVDFSDSVELGLLVDAHRRAQSGGPRLAIVRAGRNVRRIVRMAGFERVLPLADDPDAR